MAFPTSTFLGQTVGFDEIDQSPSRSQTEGVAVITIMGMTAWSDVDAFINFLLPVGSFVGPVFGPSLAANYIFRVFDYAVEGFGGLTTPGANGLNAYQLAKWKIKCHVPMSQLPDLSQPYNPDPTGGIIHTWTTGGQWLTQSNLALQWTTDQAVPASKVVGALFIPTTEHTLEWPRLLNPPFAAIRACMRSINNAPFQLATGTIATGQGLFIGAGCRTEALSNGSIVRTLSYKISERPLVAPDGTVLDWNYSKRDDGKAGSAGGWDKLQSRADNSFTYPSTNFAALFPNTF